MFRNNSKTIHFSRIASAFNILKVIQSNRFGLDSKVHLSWFSIRLNSAIIELRFFQLSESKSKIYFSNSSISSKMEVVL